MKYQPFRCKDTSIISKQLNTNSLLAKVIEFNQYDESVIEGMLSNRIIYHDFSLFEDADITIDRIQDAIDNKEKICIYGDYDCDGIMATTILVQAFKELGVEVGYHIPNRFNDGYGLNKERVIQMADKGYSLIITVDNGIAANEAINTANELGIDVIVTDHHGLQDQLPDACAIIHTQVSYEYPFKEICGAFVAYKLAAFLLGHQDKYLYTLASIATLADMMPLVDENRSIIKRSLYFMNTERYQALELLVGDQKNYTTQLLNFTLIPKINSMGRLPELGNPNMLVKYFLKDCDAQLRTQIATKCSEINEQRKNLTVSSISEIPLQNDRYIFYASDTLHLGILGLIAGRLTNSYQLPSFIMNYNPDTNTYVGSCRSVDGFSIKDFFNEYHDLFIACGGHDAAGGYTIHKDYLEDFKSSLDFKLSESLKEPIINTIVLDSDDISISNIESLSVLEPYGNGNNEPLFQVDNVEILSKQLLSNGKHLKLHCRIDNIELDCLFFNVKSKINDLKLEGNVTLIGTLSINTYRNTKSINFMIKDML